MSFFSELGLAEPIARALNAKGYADPTPIQRQAIPALLEGRDLMGIAQTGTGKTAAFALPSLHRLAESGTPRKAASCRMLVLSPTRELAAQIADNMRGYARFLTMNIQVVFGGVPAGKQARALVPGCDVLVATPGRLLDLIDQRALTLRDVEIFVLDEADQMMDLGFIHPLKRIAALLPQRRQSLFFSATMPKAIADLGRQFIHDPVRVEVTPQATTAERVEQRVTHVNQAEKQALLTLSLRAGLADGSMDRALVFSRTKHGADRVVKHLVAAGVPAVAIHGNKSQGQRTAAIQGFRSGALRVLVATDIAARGIDIPGVSHVYNFEMPNVPDQYVHRIGRTARAGRDGIAISYVAPDERAYLRDIEKLTRVKLEPLPLPEGFQAEAARLPAPARNPAPEPRREASRQGAGGGRDGRRDGQSGERRGGQFGERRDGQFGERRDGQPGERRSGHPGERRAGHDGDRRPAPGGERRPATGAERRPATGAERRPAAGAERREAPAGGRRDGQPNGPRREGQGGFGTGHNKPRPPRGNGHGGGNGHGSGHGHGNGSGASGHSGQSGNKPRRPDRPGASGPVANPLRTGR